MNFTLIQAPGLSFKLFAEHVAYRRLKSDTTDFLLSKWHDSPASSLCLAEIARRAAMSMLFACSSAYNTKEGMWHETGRPQEVCTEYYSDFVSCVFPCNFTNPESPHCSNFGLEELLLHISQLLLVATQPIGEACSKSLTNWSPSDRKRFQKSFFDIQCQFPSSRSSKSSKLLRNARSAPSSCLSSWRPTKLATWWSRGSENLAQTSQTDMKRTNRWELRIWHSMYKSSFMWRRDTALTSLKRTVGYKKDCKKR